MHVRTIRTHSLFTVFGHPLAAVAIIAIALGLGFAPGAHANLITNPSFETPEATHIFGHPGLPAIFGDWGGDLSEIVVAENGIAPLDGAHMLRFDATGNNADPLLNSSEVWQTVDVSGYATEIAQGDATANLSAFFNRVCGDSQTDTGFGVRVYAFAGAPGSLLTQVVGGTHLDVIGNGIGTDGDPSTWEMVSTSLLLPTGTDFLAVRLAASENVFNDGIHPEFDGHYADLVSANIIPEPATLLLLSVGFLGLTRYRRSIV